MGNNRLDDQGADRKYFTIVPNIVWALALDTYEFTLWTVVKMIAGEDGECYVGTEDLAAMAMMSTGKLSQCRKRLIEAGLLAGGIRRDPGYTQAVWHLTIPDLWQRNLEVRAATGDKLKDRMAFKTNGGSLHLVKPSPGEGKPSPDESKPSPGETKNIHQEEPSIITNDDDDHSNQETEQIVAILVKLDVSPKVARDLALTCDLATVEGWTAFAKENASNPAAYVVSMLKEGASVPEETTDGTGTDIDKATEAARARYALQFLRGNGK